MSASKDPIHPDDIPHPTLTRSRSFFLAAAIIFPIWAITPASWIYASVCLWRLMHNEGNTESSTSQKILVVWAIFECIFSVYHVYLVGTLGRRPLAFQITDTDHLRSMFHRILHMGLHGVDGTTTPLPLPYQAGEPLRIDDIPVLDRSDPRAIDFRQSLRTWFAMSRWSDLTQLHLQSWISWSMFNKSYDDLDSEHKSLISHAMEMMERRAGAKVPHAAPGWSRVKTIRLTLDPLSVQSRPAIAYVTINAVAYIAKEWYRVHYGVKYERMGDLEYLIRVPSKPAPKTSRNEDTSPVVFLHGLGIGLAQYHLVISEMLGSPKFESRIIIVPIQPHVSQSILHPRHLEPLSREKTLRDLRSVISKSLKLQSSLQSEPCEKVTLLSHSNGTVLHAWLLKAYPELVGRSCFVDPVIFCLWEGDVCYNFVYKPPSNGIELLMRYFVGSELGIANYIQRNFDWSANTLFFEEIPNALDSSKTMFFLGEKDSIIAAHRVQLYLRTHGAIENVHYHEGAAHGEALMAGGKTMKKMMDWLNGI